MAQNTHENKNDHHNLLRWNPPLNGWLKCNVDAGFNINRETTNRGWCLRDNLSNFVTEGVVWDVGTFPILKAEALTLKEAIRGPITLHLNHMVFESDS